MDPYASVSREVSDGNATRRALLRAASGDALARRPGRQEIAPRRRSPPRAPQRSFAKPTASRLPGALSTARSTHP